MNKGKKIIINADDIGDHPEAIESAINLWEKGKISSVSLFANGNDFLNSVNKLKKYKVPVGIHLRLTNGNPLLQCNKVPSLCNKKGTFYNDLDNLYQIYDLNDVEKELRAQIEKVLKSGINPTFIDSHEGVLYDKSNLRKLYVKLANQYSLSAVLPNHIIFNGLKRRVRRNGKQATDSLFCIYFHDNVDGDLFNFRLKQYNEVFKKLKKGIHFFACHPMKLTEQLKGKYDDFLIRSTDYNLLLSSEWTNLIKLYNFEVTSL